MNSSESRLILELWENVRDQLPAAKRTDVAVVWIRAFEDYGFEPEDMADLIGEDRNLEEAFQLLYGDDEEDFDEDYDDDSED